MKHTKGLWKNKKIKFLATTILCSSSFAYAALPPQHQNSNDLHAMLSYVNANPVVMSGLQAIDLLSQTVFYGEGCTAVFERLVIEKPAGWVGPADPLVLKEDSCPNYDEMSSDVHDHAHDDMDEADSITLRDTDACTVDVEVESCKP